MEKTLVNDLYCEQQVLGILLNYPKLYHEVSDLLSEKMFYQNSHAIVFKAIQSLTNEGKEADFVNTCAWIAHHEPKANVDKMELLSMMESVVTTTQLHTFCRRLKDLWMRRELWKVGQQLVMAGYNEQEETQTVRQEAIEGVAAIDERPATCIQTTEEVLKVLRTIVDNNLSGQRKSGIPTGFKWLDAKGGLQRSDLVVIAAEFSQGKTSLAIDLCVNAARWGYPCVFYSTEMMSHQLMARIIAGHSGLSSRVILQEKITSSQMQYYDNSVELVRRLPIYFDDTATLNIERIIASIRTMVRKRKVAVAFVDYLQVLQTNEKNRNQNEEQFFGVVTRRLKNLAKELNICIVLISQLSRDKKTVEPTLSRVRGSGQIAEAADMVLLIYRPEQYNTHYTGCYREVCTHGTALIRLAKGRNVGTGDFICGFNPTTTHFFDLSVVPKGNNPNALVDNETPF